MQAAFVGRSEYFRALFRDHFRETSRTGVCDKAIKQKEGMEGRSEIDLMTLRDVTPEVKFYKTFHVILAQQYLKNKMKVKNFKPYYLTGVCASGLIRLL